MWCAECVWCVLGIVCVWSAGVRILSPVMKGVKGKGNAAGTETWAMICNATGARFHMLIQHTGVCVCAGCECVCECIYFVCEFSV